MRYSEFKIVEWVCGKCYSEPCGCEVLTEAEARIQHAEDIVFWEGSKGATRALNALKSMATGGHKDTTIKWDGSPALIFGRNENGDFILTDKSGFSAKGYDGKATSADMLGKVLGNRKVKDPSPKKLADREKFIQNMKDIFDEYQKAVAPNFRGYFKGDLLYYNTPPKLNGRYSFTPQLVTYEVDADSALGMKIGTSKTGIVIHRYIDLQGKETGVTPQGLESALQGSEVLAMPPTYAVQAANVDMKSIKQLETIVKMNAPKIDELLNQVELKQKKLSGFADMLYTYLNSKVDTGLNNLGVDFKDWVASSKLSGPMRTRVLEHIGQHPTAFNALWKVVSGIIKVKDDIINQFDSHDADVVQKIGKSSGGEGYVMAHPEGDIKLVPREYFSKANRAKVR